MGCLPVVAPGYFPANAVVGTNTSGVWLEVMGLVNDLLGLGYLARRTPALVRHLRSLKVPAPGTYVPATILRPALMLSQSAKSFNEALAKPADRRVAA